MTEHDPRLDDLHICGAKRVGPSGVKWICVAYPHPNETVPVGPEQHLFIRNTKEEPDEGDEESLQ